MRSLKILFFIFLPFLAIGQARVSIDLIYSFDKGFRSINSPDPSIIDLKDMNEKSKNGARYGVNLNYYLNQKITLKSGVRWVKTGYHSDLENENYDYKFIEIPVGLRYYYSENRFRLFSELGIGFHYLNESNNNQININDQRWSIVGMVGLGIDFDYSPDLSFFAQPIFRYHLTETNDSNGLLEENLYNTGVELGFRVKF